MLLNRGVWKDERYMIRKSNAMSLDPLLREYVWHKGEIMPDCVLKLVRTWYPNPEGLILLNVLRPLFCALTLG